MSEKRFIDVNHTTTLWVSLSWAPKLPIVLSRATQKTIAGRCAKVIAYELGERPRITVCVAFSDHARVDHRGLVITSFIVLAAAMAPSSVPIVFIAVVEVVSTVIFAFPMIATPAVAVVSVAITFIPISLLILLV
jgi:hypothetical protein